MEEALILEPESPAPAGQIGRVLAYHFDLHPTDAIARVRYGGGVLIERGAPEKVREVQERLREIGVSTRVVLSQDLLDTPRGCRVIALEFRRDSLLARMVGGRELVVPREEIHAVHVFALEPEAKRGEKTSKEERRLEEENDRLLKRSFLSGFEDRDSREAIEAGLSPRGRRLLDNIAEARLPCLAFCLTIYCSYPTGPVRIRKDDFDFSCLEKQKQAHSLDNFLILLDDVLEYLPDAWNREPAVEFLHELRPRTILRFKEEEINNFDRWMLQWVRLADAGATSPAASEEGNP